MQHDDLPYLNSSHWCIDLADLDLPPSSQCSECGRALADHDGVFVEDGEPICSTCLDSALAEEWPNAVAYARENVQLTGTPEVFEPELRHACTPDEYAMGAKESYTVYSVFAFNRHNRTNYDSLIHNLNRDDPLDAQQYAAILARVCELLGVREDE